MTAPEQPEHVEHAQPEHDRDDPPTVPGGIPLLESVTTKPSSERSEVLLVTGMSGAGRSRAAAVLEDLDWYVVDNLPPRLLAPLVGILLLEARRAGALVVGEDLGTVEPWVRDYLRDRGILGTSVAWFEMQDGGVPLPPEAYREYCMASVTTHDMPPTAGYLALDHIRLQHGLGMLTESLDDELGLAERTGVLGRPGEPWTVVGEGEVRWLAPGATTPLVVGPGETIRLESAG